MYGPDEAILLMFEFQVERHSMATCIPRVEASQFGIKA